MRALPNVPGSAGRARGQAARGCLRPRPGPAFSASEGVWAAARSAPPPRAGSLWILIAPSRESFLVMRGKNIQQPVFALGVLDTLPCFGIRHMHVVGGKLLSAGQKRSSPLLCAPRPAEGAGSPRGWWTPQLPGGGEAAGPGLPLPPSSEAPPSAARPPASPQPGLRPPPSRPAARAWAVLRGAGARAGPADSEPSGILY